MTSKVNYPELILRCENRIRAGEVSQAARELSALNHVRVPREFRLPLAKLCRRSGCVSLGLKLLTPLTRALQEKKNMSPTPGEWAEYAVLLQINGSVNEAVTILEKVDASKAPEALLYRSFCHFNRWEYGAAVPILDEYVASGIDDYARLVGSVNLLAALAMEKEHDRALHLLESLLPACRRGQYLRLEANCLELRAQVHLQSGDWDRASLDLEQAVKTLGQANIPDTLFILKWRALIEARVTGSTGPLDRLREEARRRHVWETDREVDFLALTLRFEQDRFEKLIFGTPHGAYRRRVLAELKTDVKSPYADVGDPNGPLFEVESGTWRGEQILKAGSKTHAILAILAHDRYKPLGVGSLFSELFAGEHFDIFSSPDRIHQIIRRTRQWIDESRVGFELVEEKGKYRLNCDGIRLRLPFEKTPLQRGEILFRCLLSSGKNRWTASEIRGRLGLTPAEYRQFIDWSLTEGRLERSYDGSTPLYGVPVKDRRAA